jgi:hypothetical protein
MSNLCVKSWVSRDAKSDADKRWVSFHQNREECIVVVTRAQTRLNGFSKMDPVEENPGFVIGVVGSRHPGRLCTIKIKWLVSSVQPRHSSNAAAKTVYRPLYGLQQTASSRAV